MATESWTSIRLLQWTQDFFRQKGIEGPRLESEILLAHVLKCQRIMLYTMPDEQPEPVRAAYRELIKKRAEGCPVAYLVGYKEFHLLKFEVTPATLIPRPETEQLVMVVLDEIKKLDQPKVLDVGTGSGCIAVTVAKQNPKALVVAVDKSEQALEVARRNASANGVSERVDCRSSDLFAGVRKDEGFDCIVSNPPYVTEAEYAALDKTVRDFEPKESLLAGADGLSVYKSLIPGALPSLKPGGLLALEIGSTQQEAVERLARNAGYVEVKTLPDDRKLPRIVLARRA